MTRVDLDAVDRHVAAVVPCEECQPREMAAELRAAREVVDALHAWESMDGMYFGHTPQEGGNVGRALIAYDQVVGS